MQRSDYVLIVSAALFALGAGAPHDALAQSKWIKNGVTGRLIYVPDAEGDQILDFSNVGYKGRGTELLPNNIPTVMTVSPISGDDTANIQAAINAVSAMPMQANGYRGAVLLNAGDYDIATQLTINASGVVLRGVGRETTGTVLHARGTEQRSLVNISGAGSPSFFGSTYNLIDKVVPAGANSFRLDSTAGLAIGQTVRVIRPGTEAWIQAVGMDQDKGPGNPPWLPDDVNLRYDRIITRIEGNRVFVDAPLATSFDTRYGGGTLQRYTFAGEIENVGVENIRGESDFNPAEKSGSDFIDEDHATTFVDVSKSKNTWVRNSLAKYFVYAAAEAHWDGRSFTVDNVVSDEPVSLVQGGRRYSFDLRSQQGFVANSTANKGRHDFVNNGGEMSAGPNVFYNSSSTDSRSDSGPHMGWSTGTLFDNITVQGNRINARNTDTSGTRHGWTGANMVVWNSTADGFIVQNPPTSQNWLVGQTGPIINDTTYGTQPPGNYDSSGVKVTAGGEQSLYVAQSNDSADIREFHWKGSIGNWNDQLAWQEKVKPGVYSVHLRDYMVGDIDSFTYDGTASVDNAYADPAWKAAVASNSSLPQTGFDDSGTNKNVVFTVQNQLDPGERVVHGFLALSLKGTSSNTATDFVRLFDMAPGHQITYVSQGWNVGQSTPLVSVIDLGKYLDQLQTGLMNVQVGGRSTVDWAIYTATVATPIADAVGPTVFLDSGSVRVDSPIGPVASLVNGGPAYSRLTIAAGQTLTVNDDYQQAANGTLKIEIAGASQFGKISIGDNALLGGTVMLELMNGYIPAFGTTFEFLSANSLLGTDFDASVLPTVGNTLTWQFIYDADSVIARVVVPGDYNRDGNVNSADYDVWQSQFGQIVRTTGDGADGNRNGRVDEADYLLWQSHLGWSPGQGSGANSDAVPEPGFLASATFIFATSILFRRRQSSSQLR